MRYLIIIRNYAVSVLFKGLPNDGNIATIDDVIRYAQASSSPAQHNTPPSTSVSMMRTPLHRTTHFDFLENHPKIRLSIFLYVLGVVSPKKL